MMTFGQLFGMGLMTGVLLFVGVVAGYLPIMIPWKWYREGYRPIRPLVSDLLDSNLIHEWIGSLSVMFWLSITLYFSIALFWACVLWLLQLAGLF